MVASLNLRRSVTRESLVVLGCFGESLSEQLKRAVQLSKYSRPQDPGDLQLGRPRLGVDYLLQLPSLGSESDRAGSSVGRIGHASEVPVSFQVPEQVVDRLFRDPRQVRKLART